MSSETSAPTQYKPVTVDVPEDRVAEFHAFFARFLSGPMGRRRHGRHGERHGEHRGSRCGARGEREERNEPEVAPTEV